MPTYNDYPSEPIGGKNPYHKCSYCGISAPQINMELEGHLTDCEYRVKKEQELKSKSKG